MGSGELSIRRERQEGGKFVGGRDRVEQLAGAREVAAAPGGLAELADDDTPINPVRLPQSARISSQILTSEDVEKLQARDIYDLLNYGTGVFTTTSYRWP